LHVQTWYAKGPLELEELEIKYKRCLTQSRSQTIFGFICYYNKTPIGYIQYYSIKRHQWLNVDLTHFLDNSAGIDVFIGEKDFLGKGLGVKIINRFLTRHVFREFDYCFVDPRKDNLTALACYKKCGFEEFSQIQSDEQEAFEILIKKRSSLKNLMHNKRDQTKTQQPRYKKNFICQYISNAKFYWGNKPNNHSSNARKTP
jgi:RimJ/RimL family protein N-acetyltransferase